MNKKDAWDKFKKSGKVVDYLEYAQKKGEENDNESRRDNRK